MWGPSRIYTGSSIIEHLYAASGWYLSEIFNLYADDTQLYFPLKVGDSFFSCFNDIKEWMAASFLHLNESKTKVLVFGPPSL